jgi:hypothetical protein
MQIDGQFVRITPGELEYKMDVLLPRAQWVSPSLLRGIANIKPSRSQKLVLAHPCCSVRLAESILNKNPPPQPNAWSGDHDWMECRLIVADNPVFPLELRRRCLSEMLQSKTSSQDTLRALLHPLSTTEMQLAASEHVLVDGAGYMFNAEPEFWAKLHTVVDRRWMASILRGPACPKSFRAMLQLAASS